MEANRNEKMNKILDAYLWWEVGVDEERSRLLYTYAL